MDFPSILCAAGLLRSDIRFRTSPVMLEIPKPIILERYRNKICFFSHFSTTKNLVAWRGTRCYVIEVTPWILLLWKFLKSIKISCFFYRRRRQLQWHSPIEGMILYCFSLSAAVFRNVGLNNSGPLELSTV